MKIVLLLFFDLPSNLLLLFLVFELAVHENDEHVDQNHDHKEIVYFERDCGNQRLCIEHKRDAISVAQDCRKDDNKGSELSGKLVNAASEVKVSEQTDSQIDHEQEK